MKKPSAKKYDHGITKNKKAKKQCAEDIGIPTDGAAYFKSLEDLETVEYVRCKIRDAHIFKVPTARSSSGWSATELTEELWQGTIKVVDRGSFSGVILMDRVTDELFAVCPLEEEVERCTDSSRYFIYKVKNAADEKLSRIGIVFNERTHAFDFNVALETSKKEKEARETNSVTKGSVTTKYEEAIPEPGKVLPPTAEAKQKSKVSNGSAPITFPFLGTQKGGLLQPPKNDTKDNRRKSAKNGSSEKKANGASEADIPEFADFRFENTDDETAAQVQYKSTFLSRICCATY